MANQIKPWERPRIARVMQLFNGKVVAINEYEDKERDRDEDEIQR